MADVSLDEKTPLMLKEDPTLFVGPEAWAVLGAREVWSKVYAALKSGDDIAEVLFETWPELVAFDVVHNYWIEADRAQGGKTWAKRVAWWDNTVAQRQQVVDAHRPIYEKLETSLKGMA